MYRCPGSRPPKLLHAATHVSVLVLIASCAVAGDDAFTAKIRRANDGIYREAASICRQLAESTTANDWHGNYTGCLARSEYILQSGGSLDLGDKVVQFGTVTPPPAGVPQYTYVRPAPSSKAPQQAPQGPQDSEPAVASNSDGDRGRRALGKLVGIGACQYILEMQAVLSLGGPPSDEEKERTQRCIKLMKSSLSGQH